MYALATARDCADVQARLSDYLDGELAEDERARLTLHLVACSACARLALELAVVVGALHQLHAGRVAPAGAASSPRSAR